MKFTYTYRSSDGQRHTAEIEAENRDAAFARVRNELGIKPIKVVATGDHATGEGSGKSAASPRWGTFLVIALIVTILLIALAAWWWAARSASAPYQPAPAQEPTTYTVNTPQGPVTLRVAEPLPRQMIPGNRQRIEGDRDSIFTNAAERLLSRFAEPGRAVAAPEGARPTEAEFRACLREPVRVASNELTEHIDLKRIVTGMKREMRAYLAGGGTVDGYLAELEKRQRLEVSYRERAEQKLNELLSAANGQAARSADGNLNEQAARSADGRAAARPSRGRARSPSAPLTETTSDALKAAYAYWLKANAQLQAMGIYPLALPDALRSYQMNLDIEE